MKSRMFRIACAIYIVIITQTCFAQGNFSLGAKAGIDIPNLSAGNSGSNPVSHGWSSRLGPYFGVVGEHRFNNKWALQLELNYSSQGGKKNGRQAIPVSYFTSSPPAGTPEYVYANFKSETKLNYIELPVMAKITLPISSNWHFFAQAGPYVGFLIAAKTTVKGNSPIYADEEETTILFPAITINQSQDVKSDIKKFNAGLQGGAGIAVKAPLGSLMLTVGGNYGFIPIQKDKANGKNITGAANITIGYLFSL